MSLWEVNHALIMKIEDDLNLTHTFSGVGIEGEPTSFGAQFYPGMSGIWMYRSYSVPVSLGGINQTYNIRSLVFATRSGNYRNNT